VTVNYADGSSELVIEDGRYPLTMLLRIVAAQVIVLLCCR